MRKQKNNVRGGKGITTTKAEYPKKETYGTLQVLQVSLVEVIHVEGLLEGL